MQAFTLSSTEKAELEIRHRNARDSRESDRLKAILLRSEGWSLKAIAQALRKHENRIRDYVQSYVESKKVTDARGGSAGKLSESQTQELLAHLESHLYQYNYQIVAYIKKQYEVEFSVPGLHKWLKRHGFVYKKAKGYPHKADMALQAEFISAYETLKKGLGSQEVIVFGDSVHPSQATKLSYGWIKKGSDKAVQTTASRTRMNIVGAIELGALDKAVIADYETINAESIVDFLTQLRRAYPSCQTLHWIVDGAGYHKAQAVKDKAEELDIKLHLLPPYSPNLNPIERLWKVMNKKVRDNTFFSSAKDFRQRILDFFQKTLPNIAASLDNTINDNFQRLDKLLLPG